MATDLHTTIATWSAAVTFALSGVLLFYALGLRASRVLERRSRHRLMQRWWPVFARAIASGSVPGDDAGETAPRLSRLGVLREWVRFRSQVRGSAAESMERLGAGLGLRETARRCLKNRSSARRLLGIQALGYLRDRESWPAIVSFLDAPQLSISATAARALVSIDAEPAVRLILDRCGERGSWPDTLIGNLLDAAGADAVSPGLCAALRNADGQRLVRLLGFYETAHTTDVDPIIGDILESDADADVLSAALRANRSSISPELAARLAAHPVSYVRIQLASLLGRAGRREDFQVLEPLLADTDWWVRYRAAQSIVRLPFMGPNALRKLRNRQSDRYARDIMDHALAEVGLL